MDIPKSVTNVFETTLTIIKTRLRKIKKNKKKNEVENVHLKNIASKRNRNCARPAVFTGDIVDLPND